MASFVLLLKDYEDDEKVIYYFGPNEHVMGKIELNKKKDTIQEMVRNFKIKLKELF